jgi:hypothetical protein
VRDLRCAGALPVQWHDMRGLQKSGRRRRPGCVPSSGRSCGCRPRTSMSMRLNSSKQAQAPLCASPLKNLPMNCGRRGGGGAGARGAEVGQVDQVGCPQLSGPPQRRWRHIQYACTPPKQAAHDRAAPAAAAPSSSSLDQPPAASCPHLVVQVVATVKHHAVDPKRLAQVLRGLGLASA